VRADVDAHGTRVALRAEVAAAVEGVEPRQDLVQDALRQCRVRPPVLGGEVARRGALGATFERERLAGRVRRVRHRVGELAPHEEAPRLGLTNQALQVPLRQDGLEGYFGLPVLGSEYYWTSGKSVGDETNDRTNLHGDDTTADSRRPRFCARIKEIEGSRSLRTARSLRNI